MSVSLVPRECHFERGILHQNFIAENETFLNGIPIHVDTCKCYVTDSESSWPGNKY